MRVLCETVAMISRSSVASFALVLVSCAGAADTPKAPEALESPAPTQTMDAGAIALCKSEVIALPPEFAKGLPEGQETIWFAPGMFQAQANDYFTYQFVLRFDAPQEIATANLQAVLLGYYEGLMTAVAAGKGRKHAAGATVVEVQPSAKAFASKSCGTEACPDSVQFFEASIATIDEFVTGESLALHVVLAVTPNRVAAHVVPKHSWNAAQPSLSLPCLVTAP